MSTRVASDQGIPLIVLVDTTQVSIDCNELLHVLISVMKSIALVA